MDVQEQLSGQIQAAFPFLLVPLPILGFEPEGIMFELSPLPLAILAMLPCFTVSGGSEFLAKKLSLHFGGPVAVSYRRTWKGACK